jgi:hypothetical protein
MTGNGNKARPVRTLTVKNFSVIKEAKLEFGKITVLIGPQASGKSLLCKLAFFFEQVVPERIRDLFLRDTSYAELCQAIQMEFFEKFPEELWARGNSGISYESNEFILSTETGRSQRPHTFAFDSEFADNYPKWIEQNRWARESAGPGVNVGRVFSAPQIAKASVERGRIDIEPPMIQNSAYIPTGRSFYSITNRAFAALTTKNLDWVTQRYAPQFDSEYKSLRESYGSESAALSEFGKLATHILKGRVVHEQGRLVFESTEDGRRLPFDLLSSGTLELLPLINTLSQLAAESSSPSFGELPEPPFGTIYIEEPESSVFPSTQCALVRLVAWFARLDRLRMDYVITTHSPYILSAFNNLIFAGQLGQDNRLKKKIKIEERYWIEPGTFRAYNIHDGKLESILSNSGLIDGDYLDSVSETIGNEFDEMLRLEYGKTKAS